MKLSSSELHQEIDEFISQYLIDKRQDTKGTYKRALHEFERYFTLKRDTFRFKPEHISAYKTYLSRERSLSDVTVSTYLTSVRRLCDYFVSKGLLPGNPAKNVKGNRRPKSHSIGVLSYEEAQILKSSIPINPPQCFRDQIMVRLMLECAVSEQELVNCNIEDFNSQSEPPTLYVQPKGQSTKTDLIQLSTQLSIQISDYLKQRENTSSNEPLFVSHGPRIRNQRLSTRAVRYRIKFWLEKCGLKRPDITTNSLRHTAAYLWLNHDKLSLEEVQKKMRHGMIETTEIYIGLKNT